MQDVNDEPTSGQVTEHGEWLVQYADIMNNPKNPHYDGFKRGDPKTMHYVDEQYKRIFGSGQVRIGSVESISSHPINLSEKPSEPEDQGQDVKTADEARAHSESQLTPTEAALRQAMEEQGEDFLAEQRHAGIAHARLFAGEDGMAAYTRLQQRVQELPPQQRVAAEVATLFYLSEMGQLFSERRT